MVDYADVSEIDEMDELYANRPAIRDIASMCNVLDIEIDDFRTIANDDAWAYYYELKAKLDQQQRKTA